MLGSLEQQSVRAPLADRVDGEGRAVAKDLARAGHVLPKRHFHFAPAHRGQFIELRRALDDT